MKKKFVLFVVLPILLIGCAATSTDQVGQAQRAGSEAAAVSPGEPEEPGKSEWHPPEPSTEVARRPWGGVWNVPAGMSPPKSSTVTENTTTTAAAVETPQPPDRLPEPEEVRAQVEGVGVKGGSEEIALNAPDPGDSANPLKSSPPNRRPWGGFWHAPVCPPSQRGGGEEEASSQDVEMPPPSSWEDYEWVDFGKFASGSYITDYANKYLKMECWFSRIAPELIEIPDFPKPKYTTFIVTRVGSQLHSISVAMQKLNAGAVYKLKPKRKIVLYGKAVMVDSHTLTMDVLRIDKK